MRASIVFRPAAGIASCEPVAERARTLAGARLTLTAESGKLGIADDAARTKLLAPRAVKLGDRDERATLYGDLRVESLDILEAA